ncbi:MAG: glutamate 5-kinase, partial [Pseudomonadota bacterium]
DEGSIREDWMASLATDLASLTRAGGDVAPDIAIVSSGAVGVGRRRLNLPDRLKLEEKQAAAAAGQPLIAAAWARAFGAHRRQTAQILLTLADMESRRRYLNARATLETLFSLGAAPIVNENDTTATDELRYGDNDRLAAHVAQTCGADLLVILSDVDGLYDRDPRVHADAAHIAHVTEITAALEAGAGGPNAEDAVGSGGMRTKLAAAKIAVAAGCAAIVGEGARPSPIAALIDGARATVFKPTATPENARRAWIAGRLSATGAAHVDQGAADALAGGASLLSAGVVHVDGAFEKGDAIAVVDPAGAMLGQGLSAYSSDELRRIVGLKSADVEATLGYRRAAAIHRDDLVLLDRRGDRP